MSSPSKGESGSGRVRASDSGSRAEGAPRRRRRRQLSQGDDDRSSAAEKSEQPSTKSVRSPAHAGGRSTRGSGGRPSAPAYSAPPPQHKQTGERRAARSSERAKRESGQTEPMSQGVSSERSGKKSHEPRARDQTGDGMQSSPLLKINDPLQLESETRAEQTFEPKRDEKADEAVRSRKKKSGASTGKHKVSSGDGDRPSSLWEPILVTAPAEDSHRKVVILQRSGERVDGVVDVADGLEDRVEENHGVSVGMSKASRGKLEKDGGMQQQRQQQQQQEQGKGKQKKGKQIVERDEPKSESRTEQKRPLRLPEKKVNFNS